MNRATIVLTLLIIFLWFAGPPICRAQEDSSTGVTGDSCVTCHQNPDFLVTNKKLYDYFQTWRASIHGQEGVSCTDCHGGRVDAASQATAHGTMSGSSGGETAVSFSRIPSTCGNCHEDFLQAYRKSRHFQLLKAGEKGLIGPNCVTCHGSLDARAPNVRSVRDTCQQCHNSVSGKYPEIPGQAEILLNDLNAIRGFRRYVSRRAKPEKVVELLPVFDAGIEDLARLWHGFDLEDIDADTRKLLEFALAKQQEVRAERVRAEDR